MYKINEAKYMGNKGMMTTITAQHEAKLLNIDNSQLQHQILKLSNQVSSLERSLRNT